MSVCEAEFIFFSIGYSKIHLINIITSVLNERNALLVFLEKISDIHVAVWHTVKIRECRIIVISYFNFFITMNQQDVLFYQ